VFIPRSASQQSNGLPFRPHVTIASRIGVVSSREPQTAPSVTSLCPASIFVML
jgi:hypothetical protein